jgi:outer membrane protein assembly factor BamE (lipoprotein component of BamABCDE complex)
MSICKGLYGAILALAVMMNLGCLVGGSSTTRREGSYVSQSTLNEIEPGKTSQAWIVATLGEPTSKTVLGPGHELWKYSYKETKQSGGYVFLLYAGGDTKIADGTVFVEMVNDVVTKTWRG